MGRRVDSWWRLRQTWIWAAVAAGGLVLFSYRTLVGFGLAGDYTAEARPAFDALGSGNIAEFLHRAPSYAGSLLLRAPFVLVARAFGAGGYWTYRASVIPALLAGGALAWWLATRMGSASRARWLAPLLVVGICVLNPLGEQAVIVGHPEDLLGAVLCAAAVLCAIRDRPIWAGVLLGLAITNKEWALLAVGPVLVALPRRRLLSLGSAAAVAAAITAPFLIAGAFDVTHGLQGLPGVNTGTAYHSQWQLWWFFGSGNAWDRTPPSWTAGLAHPLIVGLSLPLTLLYAYRLRRRPPPAEDALLLLAFLLLMRCVLDPWDHSYYALPFLIALVAWQALRFARLPVLALTASFIAWMLYVKVPETSLSLSLDKQAVIFMVVSVSAAAAMASSLYLPGVRDGLFRRPFKQRTLSHR
jgi:hypothetical protein